MSTGRLQIEENVAPAEALARGVALWAATSAAEPVALYGASLRSENLVLGAYQRASDALTAAARARGPVLRRRTGGVTVRAGDGVLYLALGLHERSVLMTCPKLRILNRNVRGTLAGLRTAGLATHYFGRDFVSVDAQPAAFLGWDADEQGRVLVELFVAERASYGLNPEDVAYPPRQNDALRGKAIRTLEQAGARVRGAELVQAIAGGYAAAFGVQWQPAALPLTAADASHVPSEPDDARLTWSAPREEAIGFVSAGVALDGSGKLSSVRLAGDFFQDRGCAPALERMLGGVEPTAVLIGRAIDGLYAHSAHELEGVRDLNVLREVILDAVALAKQQGAVS
ncbi:MAG TPA: hypothetical protein VHM19_01460 [Polyangiales bacterium]|nr:hypothetical protein [Polyangiales bacterium]